MQINRLYLSTYNQSLTPTTTEQASKPAKRHLALPVDRYANSSKIHFGHIPPIKDSFVATTTNLTRLEKLIDELLENKTINTQAFKNEIIQSLDLIRLQKNVLGSGVHETVYRLNDKYALKLHPTKTASQLKLIYPQNEIIVHTNEYNDLGTYKGNILAEVGEVKILENLGNHIPAGTPRGQIDYDFLKRYYENKYLPLFSKVSQDCYNAILEDCGKLNDRYRTNGTYHLFDTVNPNNIVLKNDKLYWVDEIRECKKDWNSITSVLDMMLNKYNAGRRIYDGYGASTNDARIIFKKIILAGMNADTPVRGTSYFTMEFWTNLLKNLKIDTKPQKVVNDLEAIYRIDNKDIRLCETIEYLNNLLQHTRLS